MKVFCIGSLFIIRFIIIIIICGTVVGIGRQGLIRVSKMWFFYYTIRFFVRRIYYLRGKSSFTIDIYLFGRVWGTVIRCCGIYGLFWEEREIVIGREIYGISGSTTVCKSEVIF